MSGNSMQTFDTTSIWGTHQNWPISLLVLWPVITYSLMFSLNCFWQCYAAFRAANRFAIGSGLLLLLLRAAARCCELLLLLQTCCKNLAFFCMLSTELVVISITQSTQLAQKKGWRNLFPLILGVWCNHCPKIEGLSFTPPALAGLSLVSPWLVMSLELVIEVLFLCGLVCTVRWVVSSRNVMRRSFSRHCLPIVRHPLQCRHPHIGDTAQSALFAMKVINWGDIFSCYHPNKRSPENMLSLCQLQWTILPIFLDAMASMVTTLILTNFLHWYNRPGVIAESP